MTHATAPRHEPIERRYFQEYGPVDLICSNGRWFGQRASDRKMTRRVFATRPALVKALHDGKVAWI